MDLKRKSECSENIKLIRQALVNRRKTLINKVSKLCNGNTVPLFHVLGYPDRYDRVWIHEYGYIISTNSKDELICIGKDDGNILTEEDKLNLKNWNIVY